MFFFGSSLSKMGFNLFVDLFLLEWFHLQQASDLAILYLCVTFYILFA